MKVFSLFTRLAVMVLLSVTPVITMAQNYTDSAARALPDSFSSDSFALDYADSLQTTDTIKLVPTPWQPYNLRVFLASRKKTFVRTGQVFPGIPNHNNTQAWMIAWVIGILLMVVIYKRMYPYQFGLQLAAVFNQTKFKELADTQTDIYKLGRFFALFTSVNVLGLAMYLVLDTYHIKTSYNSFVLFLIILAITTVLHIVQRILRALYAGTFNQKEFMSYYTLIQRSNGFFISLYSLPVILICYYQNSVFFKEIFIYIFLIILGLYSFYSLLRSISVNYGGRGSTLYLFLYLCSFEILPLFVMFKFINNLLFNG